MKTITQNLSAYMPMERSLIVTFSKDQDNLLEQFSMLIF